MSDAKTNGGTSFAKQVHGTSLGEQSSRPEFINSTNPTVSEKVTESSEGQEAGGHNAPRAPSAARYCSAQRRKAENTPTLTPGPSL